MNLLAFDTCNAIASASIMIDGEIIHNEIINESSKQAEKTISLIDNCLRLANKTLFELDAIAVTIGPGSFTGVRIGLSIARAFELVIKKKIIAISCFEALAYNYLDNNLPIMVAMDAKRNQIFTQNFDNGFAVAEPALIDVESLDRYMPSGKFIIVGDGCELIVPSESFRLFSAKITADMVVNAAKNKLDQNLHNHELEPIYVKGINY